MAFSAVDLEVDSDGDLVVDTNGDLKLATPAKSLSAAIFFRLKTDHRDYLDPFLGANLGEELGQPNNSFTAKSISEKCHLSLTNGLLPPGSVTIDVVPIALDKVAIFTIVKDTIRGLDSPLVTVLSYNFTTNAHELITSSV